MATPQRTLGDKGEALAEQHLAASGYTIHDRNWHCNAGELDIVAHDGSEWVFVEVRTRRAASVTTATNIAIESVSPRKQQRLIAAATAYLDAHDLEEVAWRIDLVAVTLTRAGTQIEVIKNAIE